MTDYVLDTRKFVYKGLNFRAKLYQDDVQDMDYLFDKYTDKPVNGDICYDMKTGNLVLFTTMDRQVDDEDAANKLIAKEKDKWVEDVTDFNAEDYNSGCDETDWHVFIDGARIIRFKKDNLGDVWERGNWRYATISRNYDKEPLWTRLKYAAQDFRRLYELHRGDWCQVWAKVELEINLPFSALGGLESDMDDKSWKEVLEDQAEEVLAELKKSGLQVEVDNAIKAATR